MTFILEPPKNSRDDAEALAQEVADRQAKSENRWIKLTATFQGVAGMSEYKQLFYGQPPDEEKPKDPIEIQIETYGYKQEELPSILEFEAKKRAQETGKPVTVKASTGESSSAPAPSRPSEIKDQSEGKTIKDEERKPDSSEIGAARIAAQQTVGTSDGNDEGGVGQVFGGIASIFNVFKTGATRGLSGILPSMEAIMLNIPSALLGKFTQGLPAGFQSLLPAGALGGIVGAVVNTAASGGTTSLNNLVKTVAGAAVGAAAGQALRSVTGGIGIPAVSGLAGSLGAIALNRVAQASTAAVPLNIARNTNPRATAGNTPQSSAVLATVAGTVGAAAFRGVTQGIPVGPSALGLAANVALRSVGSQLNIPTPVLGLAANFASGAISSIVGGAVGGRIPILSSNLSLPLTGALSGVAQSISATVAQTLIPANQLQGLLPQNLQNAIPRVPPRIYSPYIQNQVGVNRGRAQEQFAPSGGPRSPQDERKSTLGALQGSKLTGQERISENYTVADMSTRTRLGGCGSYILGSPSLSAAELYENMKHVGENVLELFRKQFPGFFINDGLRNGNGGSQHFLGKAVDLQWDNPNFARMAERANWAYQNIPTLKQLLLESRNGGSTYWLHIAVERGLKGPPELVGTCYPVGKNLNRIPYQNGFVKR